MDPKKKVFKTVTRLFIAAFTRNLIYRTVREEEQVSVTITVFAMDLTGN